jgi:hypothetical protein
MPKPNWDKKTISTYITQQQKEVWEKTAISECKRLADFVRDRVESTLNNDLNGKICLWLEIPQELYEKAQTEYKDNKINPLEDLIQYHIHRILTLDAGNELMWEKSASSPDIETFKAKISELERQIELLKFENEALRNRTGLFDSNAILNVLDKTEFMEVKHIAELLNRNNDENEIHELYDEVVETMFQVGMIEYVPGKGYRFNPDIEPVERAPGGKKLKIKVEK